METTSAVLNKNSMQAQVAGSRSIEWMVNTYNEWQQRSPLPGRSKRSVLSLLQLSGTKVKR